MNDPILENYFKQLHPWLDHDRLSVNMSTVEAATIIKNILSQWDVIALYPRGSGNVLSCTLQKIALMKALEVLERDYNR